MQFEDSQIQSKDFGGFDNKFLINVLLLHFDSCDWQCQLVSTWINVIIIMYLFIYWQWQYIRLYCVEWCDYLVKKEFEMLRKEGTMP